MFPLRSSTVTEAAGNSEFKIGAQQSGMLPSARYWPRCSGASQRLWTSGLGSGKKCRIPPGQNKKLGQRLNLKGSKKISQNILGVNIWMKRQEDSGRTKLENTDNSVFPSRNFLKSPTTFSPYLKHNILTPCILLWLTCISGERTVQRVRQYTCLSNTKDLIYL